MGFLKKLLNVGLVAGTTAAAIKIGEKVKANHPEGFSAGAVEPKEMMGEVVQAATELYHEAADAVKEKAPEVVEKVKGFAAGFGSESEAQATASEE